MATPDKILPLTNVLKAVGHPIAFYPNLAKAVGSINAAVFLCQFMYWEEKQHDPEGWIYKTQSNIFKETALSRCEQENARKKLRNLGILSETKRGTPAKLYYKFDWEAVDGIFSEYMTTAGEPVKKKKAPPLSEEKADPLLFRLKTTFDTYFETAHKKHDLKYQWSRDTKGGADWKNIKYFSELFRGRIAEGKEKAGEAVSVTDDEIVEGFDKFLAMLPEYHIKTNFTPALLYSKFNKIVLDIVSTRKTIDASSFKERATRALAYT